MRFTASVALATVLVGPLRMAYAIPGSPASLAPIPGGAQPSIAPGQLPTDVPWALATSVRPTRIKVLAGSVDETAIWSLFDGRSVSGVEPAGTPVRFRVELPQPTYLDAIAVFGGAAGALGVEAEGSAGTTALLQKASLAGGGARWNRRDFVKAPLSTAIIVTFEPGAPDAMLREIEFWGRPASTPASAATATLPDALYTGVPAGARELQAEEGQQTISPATVSAPGVGGTFSVDVGGDPAGIERAFLVYELSGLPHFTAVARSINGERALGRFGVARGAKGGLQVEEISPASLRSGRNRIQFFPADDKSPESYRVSDVRIVVLPRAGTRMTDASARDASALRDDSEATGWRAPASKPADTRRWEFASATQPWALDFRLPGKGYGTLTVASAGVRGGRDKGQIAVKLDGLAAGWHHVPLEKLPAADALTLTLAAGKEETAAISELVIEGSALPSDEAPRMSVTYPLSGECVNGRVHVRGFATPGAAGISAGGRRMDGALGRDGAFAFELSEKDAAGRDVVVEAAYSDGPRVRRVVSVGRCVERPPVVVAYDGRPRQPVEDLGAPYGVTVKAGQAASLSFAGVKLDIPAGAIDKDVRLTVRPLPTKQVAPLDPGMTNISPEAQAFRFGPHGMVFRKPIQMTLPYSKKLIPVGYTAGDVRTFYYSEDLHRWEQVGLLAQNDGEMVSVTEHFTDFINATVPMPEHPGTQSINPTSLKDIKLADPAAGITQIEPPAANPTGGANLRFPIEIPPGRRGLQPDLAIAYGSGNKNGWMGIGWNLSFSSIEVDTRFGVPQYDGGDTYVLDGEMLTPTATPPGAPPGVYYERRVKGRFDWIQRVPLAAPANAFYWLVTDKNGIKYTYGQNDGARLMLQGNVTPNRARTFRWYLEQVQDPFGNQIRYTYQADSGSVGTDAGNQDPFVQIYPKQIDYTAHASGSPAPGYSVVFTVGPRPVNDVVIDGRAGFQVRTQKVLQAVDVSLFGGALIREYAFAYQVGDLDKTLLQSVMVKGQGLASFYAHSFEYIQAPRQGGTLALFADPQRLPAPASQQAWDTFKNLTDTAIAGGGLGTHDGSNLSGEVGVSFLEGLAGIQGGLAGGSDDTHRLFIDVDGDGMPDPIFDSGVVDFNVIDAQHLFSALNPRPFANLSPGLGHSDNSAWNLSGSVLFGTFSGQFVRTSVNDSTVVIDMNGDGFPDIATVGLGGLQVRLNDGSNGFGGPTTWTYSLAGLTFSSPNDAQIKASLFKSDPVLRWTAPFAGQVVLGGAARKNAAGGDGVAALIYFNSDPVPKWQHTFAANETTACDPGPSNGCGGGGLTFNVSAGDQIYTRLDSISDTAVDDVVWSPTVTYQGKSLTLLEPYGAPIYQFTQSSDHRLAGLPKIPWVANAGGTVTITGALSKLATSDEVTVRVARNETTEICSQTLSAGAATFSLNVDELSGSCAAAGAASVNVAPGDRLTLEIVSDTQIDPQQIAFDPIVTYTTYCRQTQTSGLVCGAPTENCRTSGGVTGCNIPSDPAPGALIPQAVIVQHPQIFYSAPRYTGAIETATFVSSGGGSVTVQGDVLKGSGRAVLLIQGVNKLWAPKMDLGAAAGTISLNQTVGPLAAGEQLFLTIVGDEASQSISWSPTGGDPVPANVRLRAPATDDLFAGGYHQWFVADWDGDLATFDVNQAHANQVTNVNPKPFLPGLPVRRGLSFLAAPLWSGRGADFYVAAGLQKPSRRGGNFDATLKGESVNALRQSQTDNLTLGVSVVFANGAYNTGNSITQLDLIDVNGDRYPDVVANGQVSFSDGNGSFGPFTPIDMGFGDMRRIENRTISGGVGLFGSATFSNGTDSAGNTSHFALNGSISAGIAYGLSSTQVDFVDMNGDGLPDHVTRSPGDARFRVRLNYGRAFGPEIEWTSSAWADKTLGFSTSFANELVGFFASDVGVDSVRMSDTSANNGNAGLSVGGNGGGFGLSYNVSRTLVDLIDLTGDGLPDQVFKRPGEGILHVKRNLGDRFGGEEQWPLPLWSGPNLSPPDITVGIGNGDALTFGTYANDTWTVSVDIPIIPGIVDITGSVAHEDGNGSSQIAFEDIDGDGRVDQVAKVDGDAFVYAKLNQTGQTNLLKAVNRPLGGRIELAYARQGNQRSPSQGVDMPQSEYVLSQATVDDGRGSRYTSSFDYSALGPNGSPSQNVGSGFYDRTERESYGFAHVTTTRGIKQSDGSFLEGDGSRLEQFFHNGDFYRKGLLRAEYEEDKTGAIIHGTRVTHADPAADSPPPAVRSGSHFPAETQRQTLFFEKATADVNAAAPKSKTEIRLFDASGNPIQFDDLGDEQTTADDIRYTVVYSDEAGTHITRAVQVEADALASGQMLRKRLGTYGANLGTLLTLTNIVSGGRVPGTGTPGTLYNQASAVYTFTYDAFGNLRTDKDPTGYTLQYTYDTTVQTYRTRVDDLSFGYFSTASYDLRFGVVQSSTDVNGQPGSYSYDVFGRLCSVRGPDDQSASVFPTIAMSYGIVSSSCPNAPTAGAAFPAYAVTRHKDVQHANDPIDTVTFVDGLRRMIETKKDLDRDPAGNGTVTTGMSVSGQVLFDTRGRVRSQAQPGFSAAATTAFVASGNTNNPTLFSYDELGRQTNLNVPDGTAQGIQTNTSYRIVTAQAPDNLGDDRTWLVTEVRDGSAPLPPTASNVGRRLSYADSRGNRVAVREFDQIGTSTSLTPLTTKYAYDPIDQLLTATDAKGNVTSSAYDTIGQMVTLVSKDAGQTDHRFDLNGNLKEKQTPVLRAQSRFITYAHDFNRLKTITYPTLTQVAYTYGASTEKGDAAGNVAGRIKKVTYGAGNETRAYDHLGNVNKTVTTLNRISTTTGLPATIAFTMLYSYDWLGRMQNMTFPNWIDQSYQILSGSGELVSYFYDRGGNIDRITGFDQTANPQQTSAPRNFTYLSHVGYNEFEQHTVLTSGNGIANKYLYEAQTRRLSDINADSHPAGNPTTPFHRLRYTYDKVGNVTHMVNNLSVRPYLNAGVFVGPLDVTYTYDSLYQLRSMSSKYRPHVAYGYQYSDTYTFDEIGNIKTKAQSQDRLVWDNQTVNQNDTNPVVTQLAGSRFDHNVTGLTYSLSYTYPAARPHGATPVSETPAGSTTANRTYSYDANGNNTGNTFKTDTRTQVWDEENRLMQVTRNGGSLAQFRYDDQGERRKKQTSAGDAWYVNQYFVLLPNQWSTKHIFAGETRVATKTDAIWMQTPILNYYHPDHLSTTSYTSVLNQDLVQHERYFAFGELWRPGGEQEECDLGRPDNARREWLFTSKEWDVDTGLYYFGARYFDPHADVWQSPDPILTNYMKGHPNDGVFDPQNLDLYTYASNNPVRRVDPDGLFQIDPEFGRTHPKAAARIESLRSRVTYSDFKAYAEQGKSFGIKKLQDVTTVMSIFEKDKGPIVSDFYRLNETGKRDYIQMPRGMMALTNPTNDPDPNKASDPLGPHQTFLDPRITADYEAGKISDEAFDILIKHEATHPFYTRKQEDQMGVGFEPGNDYERRRYGREMTWGDLYKRRADIPQGEPGAPPPRSDGKRR